MPDSSTAPFTMSGGRLSSAPAAGQHARRPDASRTNARTGKCGCGRRRSSRRCAPPRRAAPHLVVHREQVATGLIDVDEVEDDAMRAGADSGSAIERVVGRLVAPPGAAVDENVDRRVADAAVEDVERLDLASARRRRASGRRSAPSPARSRRGGAPPPARGSAHRPPGRRRRRAPAGPCRGRPAVLGSGQDRTFMPRVPTHARRIPPASPDSPYIRVSSRFAYRQFLGRRPALALRSSVCAIGIRRRTSARPLALSATTTSRLLVCRAAARHQSHRAPGGSPSRDMVETSIEVIVGRSTWRCPPLLESAASTRHMSIESPCRLKRVRREALDQRETDAVEQVRQIVAEIEWMRSVHRERSSAAHCDS